MATYLFAGIATFAAGFVHVVLEVALIVAGLTAVRKYRPDLSMLVAGAGALELFATVGGTVFAWTLPLMFMKGSSSYDTESFMRLSAGVSMGMSLVMASGQGMIVLALVKLARGPEQASFG